MTKLRETVANLIAVKGRHHTEIAYQRLIEAYDAALAQPEQERDRGGACVVINGTSGVFTIPLPGTPGGGGISPAPSQREWQGLTAAERIDIINGALGLMDAISDAEAKLKEKNYAPNK